MIAEENKNKDSALKVNAGIEQPPSVNNEAVKKFQQKKPKDLSVDQYVEGILSRNRTILSKAITLIESCLPAHYEKAQQIIEACIPYSGNSIRIGITGVPGVGKSTFIEALGTYITNEKSRKLAVLAIDPSSTISKGSILGDKTRMEDLSVNENAFIRPSPSAGSLGGVARKTRESIILCEAAGFDTIFVETVGVGQSETAVHSMVDFFLLLMLAGAGDELQGIKRGIMEMADAIVINKADGDNYNKAQAAKNEYAMALHLFPPTGSGWHPCTEICSAKNNLNIHKVWDIILQYVDITQNNGYFDEKRKIQSKQRMYETINNALTEQFYNNPLIIEEQKNIEKLLLENKITSYAAAQKLLEIYYNQLNKY